MELSMQPMWGHPPENTSSTAEKRKGPVGPFLFATQIVDLSVGCSLRWRLAVFVDQQRLGRPFDDALIDDHFADIGL